MYEIELTPSAVKQYNNLPADYIDRVTDAIDGLQNNPRPHGYIKLKGEDAYRIRTGGYRIIYEIYDAKVVILILRIQHRKEVYRKKG